MAVNTNSTNVLDYTQDIVSLVTSLSEVKASLDNLPNYSSILERIAVSLENIELKIDNANLLSESQNTILSEIKDINLVVKSLMQDPTLGLNIKSVDLPYQGVYTRGMTRMTLEETKQDDKLKNAIKAEQISTIFK